MARCKFGTTSSSIEGRASALKIGVFTLHFFLLSAHLWLKCADRFHNVSIARSAVLPLN